jgi:hypothetical protein
MNLLIFTHSEYSFLWPILEDTVKSLYNLNPIFISDSTTIKKPEGFIEYLEYDASDCYSQRWIKILPKISSKYIIVVHDIFIILNHDYEKINILVNIVENYNIDRLSFNVFKANKYIVSNGLSICDLNTSNIQTNVFIPFDVRPSIWNKNSFFTLWLNHPNTTYRNSENESIQKFCKNNFKCFGLQVMDNEKIYYCARSPFYNLFKILIISGSGKLWNPVEVYMDMKDDFISIYDKYYLKDKIEFHQHTPSILERHWQFV